MDTTHSPYGADYLTWKSVLKQVSWAPILGMILGNLLVAVMGGISILGVLASIAIVAAFISLMAWTEMKFRRDMVAAEEVLWQIIDNVRILHDRDKAKDSQP
jgi:hypothetical protein